MTKYSIDEYMQKVQGRLDGSKQDESVPIVDYEQKVATKLSKQPEQNKPVSINDYEKKIADRLSQSEQTQPKQAERSFAAKKPESIRCLGCCKGN